MSIGKLKLKGSLSDLKNYLYAQNFELLEFDNRDLEILLTLPFHHQDPFDRLIIAQSKAKNLEIITNDQWIKIYLG